MKGKHLLQQLQAWFASGDADKLIEAYELYHVAGTTGVSGLSESSLIDDRGILRPASDPKNTHPGGRFRQYMESLGDGVKSALRHGVPMPSTGIDGLDLRLLQKTLADMITNPVTPPPEIARLFTVGRQMGIVLGEYFQILEQTYGRPADSRGRKGRY